MSEIKCPMCGRPNPSNLDTCQFCEARLKPLTDELSRSQPPIHPGDRPTEMDTGELEPVLPQWLREVRQLSRDSSEAEPEQTPPQEDEFDDQSKEPVNLLAGLQSQDDDDEEIPDWLANLRGDSNNSALSGKLDEDAGFDALKGLYDDESPPLQEQPAVSTSDFGAGSTLQQDAADPEDDNDLDWLSALGDSSDDEVALQQEFGQPATGADAPNWLAALDEESADSSPQDEFTSTPADSEDTPDWLVSLGAESTYVTPQDEPAPTPADSEDTPDWLSSLGEESANAIPQDEPVPTPADSEDTPDWLASLGVESTYAAFQDEPAPTPSDSEDTPDWLSSLGEESASASPQDEPAHTAADSEDTPDWLSSLGEESASASPQDEPALTPVNSEDTPDWLASLGEESASASPQDKPAPTVADSEETNDWFASLGTESVEELHQQESAQSAIDSDLPEWFSHHAEEGSAQQTDKLDSSFIKDELQPTSERKDETPEWLATLGDKTIEDEVPLEQSSEPSFATDELTMGMEGNAPSAFVDIKGQPLLTDDVDALLSDETPDWLSDAVRKDEGDAESYAPVTQTDELRPADLPNWVQAMRPVESVVSETGGEGEDQVVEERGPLAGLQGVLPAVQGVGPSSKPKAYSIKLQASNEQQSNAGLLEQLLAEEINPKPIITQQVVLSQRVLRWTISILILLVVGGIVFTGMQINVMPTSALLETSAALRSVQDVPADSSVLLIFDYEAAQSGEMEAAAAPLVDHMLIIKNPRLSLVSSTPTGTGLAERFIKIMQKDREYKRSERFINLGYLPGGAAGVLAFAENPVNLKSVTTDGGNAWNTPVLQDVRQLSDFSAIILITSDAESARIWIEQTEQARGDARFVVVSSAQSGPMLLPYAQSGQVDGMVIGLDGSASIEQVNNGRPGMVRRYWDAYGFGLLTAVTMIGVGSLWSLVMGWQARRKEQAESY